MGGDDESLQYLFRSTDSGKLLTESENQALNPSANTDKSRDHTFYSFYLFAILFALFLYIRLLKLRQTRIGK